VGGTGRGSPSLFEELHFGSVVMFCMLRVAWGFPLMVDTPTSSQIPPPTVVNLAKGQHWVNGWGAIA
jgi:hypothetical protein